MQGKVRISAPKKVKVNTPFKIKCLIRHPMELPEYQKDGAIVDRTYNVIDSMKAFINDKEIMSIQLSAAVSSNPYIQFKAMIDKTSELKLVYTDQHNNVYKNTKTLKVKK